MAVNSQPGGNRFALASRIPSRLALGGFESEEWLGAKGAIPIVLRKHATRAVLARSPASSGFDLVRDFAVDWTIYGIRAAMVGCGCFPHDYWRRGKIARSESVVVEVIAAMI